MHWIPYQCCGSEMCFFFLFRIRIRLPMSLSSDPNTDPTWIMHNFIKEYEMPSLTFFVLGMHTSTKFNRELISLNGLSHWIIFFLYIFLCILTLYLCRPSEASTRYCAIPGGCPPQDWQSLPCAGEELDLNPGLLICSQVCYHWATSLKYYQ